MFKSWPKLSSVKHQTATSITNAASQASPRVVCIRQRRKNAAFSAKDSASMDTAIKSSSLGAFWRYSRRISASRLPMKNVMDVLPIQSRSRWSSTTSRSPPQSSGSSTRFHIRPKELPIRPPSNSPPL